MAEPLSNKDARRRISANLQRILCARGITRTELARTTGDPLMTISACVAGKSTPNAALLARIACALETSVDRLLSDSPENFSCAS